MTMTKKELLEKIARLETDLAEVEEKSHRIEAELANVKKRIDGGGVFEPEYGQKYWVISYGGNTFDSSWVDACVDDDRYALGNCFQTRQSAEDAARVLRLIQKARESQDGFVPDWENQTQKKYYLGFDKTGILLTNCISLNIAPMFGFWKDGATCKKFINDNLQDLIWFFTEYRR